VPDIAVRFEYGITAMTFLLAMTIGVATGAMRSILSIVLVSAMLFVGAIVMLELQGSLNAMDMLTALMGYQVGLINCLIVSITLSKRKAI
jgi:hypothetical protein